MILSIRSGVRLLLSMHPEGNCNAYLSSTFFFLPLPQQLNEIKPEFHHGLKPAPSPAKGYLSVFNYHFVLFHILAETSTFTSCAICAAFECRLEGAPQMPSPTVTCFPGSLTQHRKAFAIAWPLSPHSFTGVRSLCLYRSLLLSFWRGKSR